MYHKPNTVNRPITATLTIAQRSFVELTQPTA